MFHTPFRRRLLSAVLVIAAVLALGGPAAARPVRERAEAPAAILERMSLDEKISQMIIPSLRIWVADENSAPENVTDLSRFPQLAAALRRHQYGGIILFNSNIESTRQVSRLVWDLQQNNARQEQASGPTIPYFMPLDEEGGQVLRLTMGTRMTGSMAIAATGEKAADNARLTGQILGAELAACGFHINLAPVADINNNPANPVIGTRSFSDDARHVAKLALAYAQGLASQGIIATFKHFPGHGDTGVDSHIGTPSIGKNYRQLLETELLPFQAAIRQGAEIIMTAHITFPELDEAEEYADGSRGAFPATLSHKIITEILRGRMKYKGLVMTDALEMAAIDQARLVPGEPGSVEYRANIAERAILAGADWLLTPIDMNSPGAISFYDAYISALIAKVEAGRIPLERIDESVGRILSLKMKYGLLDQDVLQVNVDQEVRRALRVVGSAPHHEAEMQMALEGVTLLKNRDQLLPLTDKKILLLGRDRLDSLGLERMSRSLQELLASRGNEVIAVDYYYQSYPEAAFHDSGALRAAIRQADVVIALSETSSAADLRSEGLPYRCLQTVIEQTHEAGGAFLLLSDKLPYDAARFPEADAILLAYMVAGIGTDPTDRNGDSGGGAYNANIEAALRIALGQESPRGRLPVNIPHIQEDEAGQLMFSEEAAYPRGSGLHYESWYLEQAGEGLARLGRILWGLGRGLFGQSTPRP